MTSRYRVPADAIVEDIDLDEEVVHLRGERVTEARAEELAREALAQAEAERTGKR